MRSLFWLLAVFAAAVAMVILGRIDAGYVLLIYPPYRV
jgi:HemY protein